MTEPSPTSPAAPAPSRRCPRCSSFDTVSGPPGTWNHCSGCGRYWDDREEEAE